MDENWYVLNTKPRQENLVELYLQMASIEVFNPKIQEVRLYRNKRKKIVVPLFPGYLFARLVPKHFEMVIYTRGVRKILGTNGRPQPVNERIIETIRERINSNGHIVIAEEKINAVLCPNDYVLIVDGPLKGFVGVVERCNGSKAVVLLLSLDYQVKAEVHCCLLKKIVPEDIEDIL